MPPRIRSKLLLVLLSLGFLYYSSDWLPFFANLRDFKVIPDVFSHHDDSSHVFTDKVHSGEVLLVSAYFPTNDTHRLNKAPAELLGNFLGTIQAPIYFFTPPGISPLIMRSRAQGSLPIVVNSSYGNPFDVPPLQGLRDYYHKMRRWGHRVPQNEEPELYALGTAKSWFLAEAVKNYGRDIFPGNKPVEYAFWVDMESFQDGLKVYDWPNVERVKEVFKEGAAVTGRNEDELIFFPVNDVPNPTMQWWKEDMGPFSRDFAQTSIFGGSAKAIQWWKDVYLKYHDYWLFERNAFVGRDRTVFNSLSLLFPDRIITVWPRDPEAPAASNDETDPLGVCGNLRWYFRCFLSSRSERQAISVFLKSRLWRMPWQIFSPIEECRLTRVLGMEDVLRKTFGSSWEPPSAELDPKANYRPNLQ